jgi:hypothetical protein
MNNHIAIPLDEYRALRRIAQGVARAKQRKAQAQQRQAYWSQVYWAQALRFETFKIGGLRFIKLGRISVSLCVTTPKEQTQ